MSVEKPIFIVGTGRCGSTMLHRLLAMHPSVGWLSTFNEVLPGQAWLSAFSNLYRIDRLPFKVRHFPAFPKPFECYRFWASYLPNFSRHDAPLGADDVPEAGIEPVRQRVARVLHYQRKPRFLHKVTGWARMAYLDRIFPDALFLWLKRDGLAVVSSWIKAGFIDVTSDIDSDSWEWGQIPERYRAWWHELGGGAALSAAVKIQLDVDDIGRNMPLFPDRSRAFRYEDLVSNPIEALQQMTAFCELEWLPAFDRVCREMDFYDASQKWRQFLSEQEAHAVRTFFERAAASGPDPESVAP